MPQGFSLKNILPVSQQPLLLIYIKLHRAIGIGQEQLFDVSLVTATFHPFVKYGLDKFLLCNHCQMAMVLHLFTLLMWAWLRSYLVVFEQRLQLFLMQASFGTICKSTSLMSSSEISICNQNVLNFSQTYVKFVMLLENKRESLPIAFLRAKY